MIVVGVLTLIWPVVMAGRMHVLASWNTVDFVFPDESAREQFLASGQFIPKNNLIIDVDVWPGSRSSSPKTFVTMPKLKPGSPVTLATVTNLTRRGVTLLQPYPDWSWHQGDCDGITSVFRIQVDDCGRLWVMDSGIVEAFSASIRQCPPQVLVFDLHTDKLIRRHRIPESLLQCNSLLITIVVDTRGRACGRSFAYMADVDGFKLFVYDFAQDKSWKVSSNLFYPHPSRGDFNVNGVNFQLMDGIFGLALGPVTDGDRLLYFHSLASVNENSVWTSVIRNGTRFLANSASAPGAFRQYRDTRSSPASAQAMTDQGVLLYALVEENAIGCWNTKDSFSKRNLDIVTKNDRNLQFQSGLKVHGDYVYSVSNRLQNYVTGQVANDEVNIRINGGRVSELLRNTKCEPKRSSRRSTWS